ncbi:MAG TPA: DUF58 domain-containing protein [Armatimonadota bacterium]|nr:DUF58 domain-containing protein [Armatimonadota bacterium]
MRLSGIAIGWLALGGLCLLAAPVFSPLFAIAILLDAALAVLLIADASLLRRAEQLTAHREHEEILSLGVENPVEVVVDNPTRLPFHIALRDAVPDSCEADAALTTGKLDAFGTFRFPYRLTPLERGRQQFGPLTLRTKTILGMLISQRTLVPDGEVKVYPNIRQTGQQQLLSRQLRERQLGVRMMRLRGQGMEFESLRDYLPDDELRKVDWMASARRGNLVTREYDVERSQQIMLVLDLGRPMASHLDYMTKLDHAVNAAVLLTYVSGLSQDRVGVMAFADDIVSYMPPGKGGAQLPHVLEQLYPLQPRQVESNYHQAFAYLANRLRKRSLIIIFTDLIDPDSSKRLVDNLALLHPQHLVLCVALGDYELKDILSGAPPDVSGMYQQAMATAVLEDRNLALSKLHQRGILTVDAAPSDLSVTVVNKYLAIKREGRV